MNIRKVAMAATLAFVLGSFAAGAHDGGTAHQTAATENTVTVPAPAKPAVTEEDRAREYFTDLPVMNHEGETLRFFTDVLKDRVVLVTFFYTDCKGMCPITNQKLANVQDLLGDRLGKDIFLITVSVDPEKDTPEVLREYRKQYEAKDGWIFLTGKKENIDAITRRMGQTYPKEAHLPLLLLGNVKAAHWQKLRPNLPEGAIAMRLKLLADENLTATN